MMIVFENVHLGARAIHWELAAFERRCRKVLDHFLVVHEQNSNMSVAGNFGSVRGLESKF